MISYKHKFIFIHVPKNAGTSIRHALRPHLRTFPQKLVDEIGKPFGYRPFHFKRYPPHLTGADYQDILGDDVFGTYRKFATVRNPWDWHVSLFAYMQQNPKHKQHDIVKDMNFSEYVHWRCAEDPTSQTPYLVDKSGQSCVTDLGRFETLVDDFNAFMSSLGLNVRLQHRNKSTRKAYQDYYDDKTIALIESISTQDIENYGYSFE